MDDDKVMKEISLSQTNFYGAFSILILRFRVLI